MAALDDRRLQVTLKAPNPAWPGYTAHPALAPRRSDLPFGLVSNGPFVLKDGGLAVHGHHDAELTGPGPFASKLEPIPTTGTGPPSGSTPSPTTWSRTRRGLRLFQMGYLHLAMSADLAEQAPGAQAMAQPATWASSSTPPPRWRMRICAGPSPWRWMRRG